jgi:hypothetical protein
VRALSFRDNRYSHLYRPSQLVDATPHLVTSAIVCTVVALVGLAVRAFGLVTVGTVMVLLGFLALVVIGVVGPIRATTVRARRRSEDG